ncbi:MAG: DUF4417 domain-containing protein [Abditibacteriota bacterium]|nr:DUF4417 domain-containing protein [Abditibacteriota bacterium]
MKINCDDGFNPEWVEGAELDGNHQIPKIIKPDFFQIPIDVLPFSKRHQTKDYSEFIIFYENDDKFGAFVKNPEKFYDELKQFPGIIGPDVSVYVDSPLIVQMANVYRNRALCYKLQKDDFYVLPNVHWGDWRSYQKNLFNEQFAFLGLPKNNIVSVGTYGQIRGKDNFNRFAEGFDAMVEELEPEIVLVYGSMP